MHSLHDPNQNTLTATELSQCLATVFLLDVRQPEEFAQSRIEGCNKLIPLGELLQRAEAELDKNADIVIYCAHGIRSMKGLLALKQLGFKKLRSLEGGIVAWEQLKLNQ